MEAEEEEEEEEEEEDVDDDHLVLLFNRSHKSTIAGNTSVVAFHWLGNAGIC